MVWLNFTTSFSKRLTEAFISSGTGNSGCTASKAYKVMSRITTAKFKVLWSPFHTLWFTNLHECFKTHFPHTWEEHIHDDGLKLWSLHLNAAINMKSIDNWKTYSVLFNFKIIAQTFSRKNIPSCSGGTTKESHLFQVTAWQPSVNHSLSL